MPKLIGTHDGTFHCDEVLACFFLKQLPEYTNAAIIRTREANELAQCDIVVDVGSVFNADERRFDHHQPNFTSTFNSFFPDKPWNIKLSSAGLIYVHYGKQIIRQICADIDDELLSILFYKLYENFVMEIDAIDNGVDIANERRYNITTNLSARVSRMNPAWNEENVESNDRFFQAIELVGSEFKERILRSVKHWWPARRIIKDAIESRFDIHPSGKIIKLKQFAPWIEHLFEIEKEKAIDGVILYVLFPNQAGTWTIRAVPSTLGSFESRKSLPSKWRGLRDEELSEVIGIPGCVFVHSTGFIGGNKTEKECTDMAIAALAAE